MYSSNKRIHSLLIQLSLAQVIFLLVLFFASFQYLKINKKKLAHAISIVSKENIINNDLRTVMINSNLIAGDDFISYRYNSNGNNLSFINPSTVTHDEFNQKLSTSFFYESIEQTIQFSDDKRIGTFTFIYYKFEYLKYVSLFWFLLIVCSTPLAIRAIKRVNRDIELDVELAKERFFGKTAKKWVHDIKQLTEPIKSELEDLNIKDVDAKINIFQSINKIDQRVLALLANKNEFIENVADFKDQISKEEYICIQKEFNTLKKELLTTYRKYKNVEILFEETNIKRVFIKASLDELKRAMFNLVTNSIEASVPERLNLIKIKVEFSKQYLSIQVQDQGIGIPKNILPKITEVNFSYSKINGTGKGMTQVKEFSNSIQANLVIDSKEGQGTNIKIKSKAIKLGVNKIVHIDDEILLQKSWKRYFKQRGVDVLSFSSPTHYLNDPPSDTKNMPVFIDSYMGDEIRGEEFSKNLCNLGHKYIYLSSADSSHIKLIDYPSIKESLGKSAKDALEILILSKK